MIAFCGAAEEFDLEYIEDPLHEPTLENLRRIHRSCRVPVALDETAQDLKALEPIIAERLCDTLVLKPMAVGSLVQLHRLTELARGRKMSVVMTSLLDSSVGICAAAACAAAWGGAGIAHGFGTVGLFTEDSLSTPRIAERGRLKLPTPSELIASLRSDLRTALDLN